MSWVKNWILRVLIFIMIPFVEMYGQGSIHQVTTNSFLWRVNLILEG